MLRQHFGEDTLDADLLRHHFSRAAAAAVVRPNTRWRVAGEAALDRTIGVHTARAPGCKSAHHAAGEADPLDAHIDAYTRLKRVTAESVPVREVLDLIADLSGISTNDILGPSRARKVSKVRSAAMHLLRTEAGLSARQAGRVLGRSPGTVLDLSRLVARGKRAGELVASVRQALAVRGFAADERAIRWAPRRVPGLRAWRLALGMTQPEVAARAGIARETLGRIERGRPVRPDVIDRLAAAFGVTCETLIRTSPGAGHQSMSGASQVVSSGAAHWSMDDLCGVSAEDVPGRCGAGPVPRVRPGRPLPGLEQCRMMAGLTQDQLAWRVGIARETLSRIERGRPARSSTVMSLAAALEVMPSMLTNAPDVDPTNQSA